MHPIDIQTTVLDDIDILCVAYPDIDGTPLRRWLERNTPTVGQVKTWIKDLTTTFATFHDKGVVHAGLNPESLYVMDDGSLSCTWVGENFALLDVTAQIFTDPTGMFVEYLAPEQIANRKTDHRSDIYALGVLWFELIAGVPLYFGAHPVDIAKQQLSQLPPYLLDVSTDCTRETADIVDKCLQKNVHRRYQSCQEILRDMAGGKKEPHLPSPVNTPAPRTVHTSLSVLQPKNAPVVSKNLAPGGKSLVTKLFGLKNMHIPKLALAVGAVAALLIGAVTFWPNSTPTSTVAPTPVVGTVPVGLVGKKISQVGNLPNSVQGQRSATTCVDGTILDTIPTAGQPYRGHYTVIVCANHKPLLDVPNLDGLSFEDAVKKLHAAGLTNIAKDPAKEYSDTVPQDKVIGLTPGDKQVSADTALTVRVSMGVQRVGYLTGVSFSYIVATLQEHKIKYVTSIDPNPSHLYRNGAIERVSVGADVAYKDLEGSTVSFVLSPGWVLMPNLVVPPQDVQAAKGRLVGLGFTGQIVDTHSVSWFVPSGRVVSQSPPAGSRLTLTTPVTIGWKQ